MAGTDSLAGSDGMCAVVSGSDFGVALCVVA